MGFLAVLSLSFVMVAGPQIITSVFLAMSENWKKASAAFVAGAALSITFVYSLSYVVFMFLLSGGSHRNSNVGHWIDGGVLLLLVVLAGLVFRNRKQTNPPKWMGKLESASPKTSFRLGFLLLGFFPSDVVTSVTVGAHLARAGTPWVQGLAFAATTVVLLALPALIVLAFGKRATAVLPKVRDWMNKNSWIVSEFVIVLFIVLTVKDLLG